MGVPLPNQASGNSVSRKARTRWKKWRSAPSYWKPVPTGTWRKAAASQARRPRLEHKMWQSVNRVGSEWREPSKMTDICKKNTWPVLLSKISSEVCHVSAVHFASVWGRGGRFIALQVSTSQNALYLTVTVHFVGSTHVKTMFIISAWKSRFKLLPSSRLKKIQYSVLPTQHYTGWNGSVSSSDEYGHCISCFNIHVMHFLRKNKQIREDDGVELEWWCHATGRTDYQSKVFLTRQAAEASSVTFSYFHRGIQGIQINKCFKKRGGETIFLLSEETACSQNWKTIKTGGRGVIYKFISFRLQITRSIKFLQNSDEWHNTQN